MRFCVIRSSAHPLIRSSAHPLIRSSAHPLIRSSAHRRWRLGEDEHGPMRTSIGSTECLALVCGARVWTIEIRINEAQM
jgi:hypothetical protein